MGVTTSTTWHGDRAVAGIVNGGVLGLNRGAQRLRALSVEEAPVDLGPLRQSASVVPATLNTQEAAVTYDTPYAVKQHEDDTLQHTAGENGEPAGKAHYLSDPLRSNSGDLLALIGKGAADGLARA